MKVRSVTRALPVRSYSLLSTDIPDVELETFMIQRFDVEALYCGMIRCLTKCYVRDKLLQLQQISHCPTQADLPVLVSRL